MWRCFLHIKGPSSTHSSTYLVSHLLRPFQCLAPTCCMQMLCWGVCILQRSPYNLASWSIIPSPYLCGPRSLLSGSLCCWEVAMNGRVESFRLSQISPSASPGNVSHVRISLLYPSFSWSPYRCTVEQALSASWWTSSPVPVPLLLALLHFYLLRRCHRRRWVTTLSSLYPLGWKALHPPSISEILLLQELNSWFDTTTSKLATTHTGSSSASTLVRYRRCSHLDGSWTLLYRWVHVGTRF